MGRFDDVDLGESNIQKRVDHFWNNWLETLNTLNLSDETKAEVLKEVKRFRDKPA